MMTRRATVFARAEVTRIVNEAYVDWHSRADRDALLSFMGLKNSAQSTAGCLSLADGTHKAVMNAVSDVSTMSSYAQ
ncbi:hypothetical protein [Paraburkholderia sp. PGU16]|nr:hypothetical protein [Paraburkholderia sp. PGU16]BEU20667.1 hypothetical protein PBP221_08070 [Paraburkholderia sp. 22B1P]